MAILYAIILYELSAYDSNRIYNIRLIPSEYRISLVERYIDKVYQKDSILILGDSQSNGYLQEDQSIFSEKLQTLMHTNVINLAFIDSRVIDNIYVLEYLKKKNMTFKVVVYNVGENQIKDVKLHHLNKVNSISYQYGILKDSRSFIDMVLHSNPGAKPNQMIDYGVYRNENNLFKMTKKNIRLYETKLKLLIKSAYKISKHLIMYVSPHPENDFYFKRHYDIQSLKEFRNQIEQLASEEGFDYLYPNVHDGKYFIDSLHFNVLGHMRMGQLLFHKINNILEEGSVKNVKLRSENQ